jgi:hypothetical protein
LTVQTFALFEESEDASDDRRPKLLQSVNVEIIDF